jgi:hypothetical protein
MLTLVYHHTRLLLLSHACGGRLSTMDLTSPVCSECLHSVLESCQTAVLNFSGDGALYYMPNNV